MYNKHCLGLAAKKVDSLPTLATPLQVMNNPNEVNMFVEIPASKSSISKRKLVYGIGINDSPYTLKPVVNGKRLRCQFYERWIGMLMRCYSDHYQNKHPSYVGCTVCNGWLLFSNFKAWMIRQDWKGNHLDKDIINLNNKIYSPDNCCFINQELNKLMCGCLEPRGKYPLGVYDHKKSNRFSVKISDHSTNVNLGTHRTPEDAGIAYARAKSIIIKRFASEQSDERIANGLRLHARSILTLK